MYKKRQSVYKIGSDAERVIVGEYGRHLEGEYVRRRLRVKALGMEEISVGDLAACRGEWGASMAYTHLTSTRHPPDMAKGMISRKFHRTCKTAAISRRMQQTSANANT